MNAGAEMGIPLSPIGRPPQEQIHDVEVLVGREAAGGKVVEQPLRAKASLWYVAGSAAYHSGKVCHMHGLERRG